MRSVNRKFATILATDCVGFSKHMLENEEGTLESLNACREIIDAFIAKHGGRIFHTAGDSVLAEFASPVESVNCAINFQDAISERNKSIAAEAENAEASEENQETVSAYEEVPEAEAEAEAGT